MNAQSGSSVSFNHSASRINGELSGTGVNLTFNDNYLFFDINNKATLNTVKTAEGKTLNIGTGTLSATNFTGGTISAVLTDAAKNTAIITGNAIDVTLALDMSNASREEVILYKITKGTGVTIRNDSKITLSYKSKFKKNYQDHTGLINFKPVLFIPLPI